MLFRECSKRRKALWGKGKQRVCVGCREDRSWHNEAVQIASRAYNASYVSQEKFRWDAWVFCGQARFPRTTLYLPVFPSGCTYLASVNHGWHARELYLCMDPPKRAWLGTRRRGAAFTTVSSLESELCVPREL